MLKKSIFLNRSVRLMMAALILVFAVGAMAPCFAGKKKVDVNALVSETQKMTQSVDEMKLIWWIPEEFWRVSFEQDPNMTKAQTENFLKILRPYTLIVAVDGAIGPMGGVTYKHKSSIKNSIKLKDQKGNFYRPLTDSQIDADTKNFLTMMKPVFVNLLGPLGQNMHFFLFPAKDVRGELVANAKKEGGFSVMLAAQEFKWRLPLASILPVKICPVDGEELSGSFKYCPYHGVRLDP